MLLLVLSIEVEGFFDLLLSGCLVDTQITNVGQEGEVDGAALILLIVMHQLQQVGIVITGDGHTAIVLFDKLYRLAHLVGGEARLYARQIEFDHQSVGYSIAVKDGGALQRQ